MAKQGSFDAPPYLLSGTSLKSKLTTTNKFYRTQRRYYTKFVVNKFNCQGQTEGQREKRYKGNAEVQK